MPAATAGDLSHHGAMVAVYVGESQKSFTLYEADLTKHSKVFRAALNQGFRETITKTIHLPEVGFRAFETYVHWIYTGGIFLGIDQEGLELSALVPGWEQRQRLFELYVLTDYLENIHLRNDVMTALVDLEKETHAGPDVRNITIAYEETPENSPLRSFALNSVIANERNTQALWLDKFGQSVPPHFILDLAHRLAAECDFLLSKILLRDGLSGLPGVQHRPHYAPCYYHEHNDEVPRCIKSN